MTHIRLLLYYYNVNDSKKDKNKNILRGRVEIPTAPLNSDQKNKRSDRKLWNGNEWLMT